MSTINVVAASPDVDWGSVPSYIGVVALLVTTATLIYGGREKRRSQANQVAAWVDIEESQTKILIKNASDLPVTTVWVRRGELRGLRLSKDNQGARTARKAIYLEHDLGPETTTTVMTYPGREIVSIISFGFRDARGVRWKRSAGKLQIDRPARWPVRAWRRFRNLVSRIRKQ